MRTVSWLDCRDRHEIERQIPSCFSFGRESDVLAGVGC